jgi:mannose-6-phosphate isomerase-like protein (cupin superfamily)
MSEMGHYNINTDIRFGPLERMDIPQMIEECREDWFNQTLCRVNDCVVRLGIIRGEFHWHKHDEEDEFFYVISGRLFIDLEDNNVNIGPTQGFTVPRGVTHRTRAPEGVVMLMVEGGGVVPTGD